MGPEIRRAGEMPITDIAGKNSVGQHVLSILCGVAYFDVALLAFVVLEDDVTFQAM